MNSQMAVVCGRRRRARARRLPRRSCSAVATRVAISSGATRSGIWVKGVPLVGFRGGVGDGV